MRDSLSPRLQCGDAITSANSLCSALSHDNGVAVLTHVFCVRRHDFKVFGAIVGFVAVKVVDTFANQQSAADFLFGHKTTLKNLLAASVFTAWGKIKTLSP